MSNNYSGVVALKNTGISQATGALLWSGKHLITAAHFADDLGSGSALEIAFNSSLNIAGLEVAAINIHPGWKNDPANYNFDVAIIELKSVVDSQIERYQIYRDFDEINAVFSRVGYSPSIDPNTGLVIDATKDFRSGLNQYDISTEQMNSVLGSNILKDYQLSYDFDNGLAEQDAYGRILGLNDLGTGSEEIFSNAGDSGGPAFINNQIAGIASYIFRYQNTAINPDINQQVDSSYGEMASDTRLSKLSNWVDSVVLGDSYVTPVPSTSEQVDIYPVEGDGSNTVNYFLLQLSAPLSVDSGVSFETFDGTAKVASDYIYNSGQVIIPAGELSVAIAVEIVADQLVESDESFGLRVFQPFGGIFPEGVSELRAEHTIIDNDQNLVLTTTAIDIIA